MFTEIKRNNIHTLINIGLMSFLILVGTIGMASMSNATTEHSDSGTGLSIINQSVMICAFGKCTLI